MLPHQDLLLHIIVDEIFELGGGRRTLPGLRKEASDLLNLWSRDDDRSGFSASDLLIRP